MTDNSKNYGFGSSVGSWIGGHFGGSTGERIGREIGKISDDMIKRQAKELQESHERNINNGFNEYDALQKALWENNMESAYDGLP